MEKILPISIHIAQIANGKLGVLDLVPVFSYLFLRGKCRYCHHPIGIRYLIFEVLTGIVFVLFGLSFHIQIDSIKPAQLIYFAFGILYLASLFILAGINKEKNTIQKSVLYFGMIVAFLYILYSCTLTRTDVYKYVMYLFMMVILMILDVRWFQKNLKNNQILPILILTLYMLIMTGEYITIFTFIFVILMIGIENMIQFFKKRKQLQIVKKDVPKPILFYMCIANIILLIGTNFLLNYLIK